MLDVGDSQPFIDHRGFLSLGHQLPDLRLVRSAPHNSLVERGGVGCDAAQTLLGDALVHRTTGEHVARQVIEPVALSAREQLQ